MEIDFMNVYDQDQFLELTLDTETYNNFTEVCSDLDISKIQLLDILGKIEKQEIIDLVISVMSEEG